MAKKIATVEELKAELLKELSSIKGMRVYISDSVAGEYDFRQMSDGFQQVLAHHIERSLERASALFDESIADKKRQLELGELADKFFQRIKLNG